MNRITFNPEITFGNIVQFVGLIGAALALWINLDRRLTTLEIRQQYQTEAMNRVIAYIDADVISKPLKQRQDWGPKQAPLK